MGIGLYWPGHGPDRAGPDTDSRDHVASHGGEGNIKRRRCERERECGMEKVGIPSTYVTILQLKQRWLHQQKTLSNDDDDSQSKNNDEAAAPVHTNPYDHRRTMKMKTKVAADDDYDDDDSDSKTQLNVDVDHPSTSTPANKKKKKKKKKGRRPRGVGNAEAEEVKKHIQPRGGGGSERNQKAVWEPEYKTPSLAPSLNETKSKRGFSGRFQGKPRTTLVWVKKGEHNLPSSASTGA